MKRIVVTMTLIVLSLVLVACTGGAATEAPSTAILTFLGEWNWSQSRAGVRSATCSASVSPGSAPSTWNGPVCGLTSVMSHKVATSDDPTEPREPTRYPSSSDLRTRRWAM